MLLFTKCFNVLPVPWLKNACNITLHSLVSALFRKKKDGEHYFPERNTSGDIWILRGQDFLKLMSL